MRKQTTTQILRISEAELMITKYEDVTVLLLPSLLIMDLIILFLFFCFSVYY